MYIKQRIFGVVLLLGSIGLIYLGWRDLWNEGTYSLKMAAFSPLIGVGGIFVMLFPTMIGAPSSTKEKVIVMAVFVVGVIAGLINWFLMDPGFFGF
jgi:phosphate/sulfate permease